MTQFARLVAAALGMRLGPGCAFHVGTEVGDVAVGVDGWTPASDWCCELCVAGGQPSCTLRATSCHVSVKKTIIWLKLTTSTFEVLDLRSPSIIRAHNIDRCRQGV
eukprot:6889268-Prymnesium_polylepis.1